MASIKGVYMDIYKSYLSSQPQQLAFTTLLSDVLKSELMWVRDNDSKFDYIEEADQIWTHFVREFLLNICLYGFVLFRVKARRNGKVIPEVAQGQDVYLKYDQDKAQWMPNALHDDSILKGTKKWNLLILEPPQRSTDQRINMRPSSSGERALEPTRQLETLEKNYFERDNFNTKPSVFTSMSKNFLSSNTNSKPWFQAVNTAMVPTPQVPQDFNTLIQDRAEAIEQLDEMSEQIRMRTHMQYAGNRGDMRVGTNGAEPPKEVQLQQT